ncbi:hypothetical protein QJS10_CPA08g00931 [Acorus calamus]|uniref:Uncharacterized protein n=1 Tax=Acorus calamus TaxID=4465 RepID=A0AAV9EB43_ACOCL|nr:hypothetical protein QJS10_CPA08g00931 [Acorus calamus]
MSAHVRTGPVGGPVNTLPCLDGGGPGSVISAVDISRATREVLLRGPKNAREAVKASWKGSWCATQSYQALCSLEGKEV